MTKHPFTSHFLLVQLWVILHLTGRRWTSLADCGLYFLLNVFVHPLCSFLLLCPLPLWFDYFLGDMFIFLYLLYIYYRFLLCFYHEAYTWQPVSLTVYFKLITTYSSSYFKAKHFYSPFPHILFLMSHFTSLKRKKSYLKK